jgi:hypothetical protein
MRKPVITLMMIEASGMYTAEITAERMDALYMFWVIPVKSSLFNSSRTRVLLVFAPMMPSLMEEVIMLFIRRVSRWYFKIFFWKYTERSATKGTAMTVISASFKLTANMAIRLATIAMQLQPKSMHTQDIISIILDMSLVSLESR